jgi:large subunit ribosomal protein L17
MRHNVKTVKLGRTSQHRDAMLSNMAGSLILKNRITTTLAKAKALRPVAEKLVTLGKVNTLHSRRLALSRLGNKADVVQKLFVEVAPRFKERQGGYTRILKLGPRKSDSAHMALIEFVDFQLPKEEAAEPAPKKGKKAPKAEESGEEKKD